MLHKNRHIDAEISKKLGIVKQDFKILEQISQYQHLGTKNLVPESCYQVLAIKGKSARILIPRNPQKTEYPCQRKMANLHKHLKCLVYTDSTAHEMSLRIFGQSLNDMPRRLKP